MRKTVVLFIVLSLIFGCTSFASANHSGEGVAQIPDYQIIIDGSLVYYADSVYPFLNYKDITYFPMTYDYCRAMNLTTGYIEGSAFMVAYQPSYESLPVYETTKNSKYNNVIIPEHYNIYVNAKKVDNKNSEYPLLNFRGVTYFPMTWEYAVDNFGWKINFENGVFTINTENNTAYRWSVEEKTEKEAVLRLYYDKEILCEDGSVDYEYYEEFYSLDYESGELERLDDYTEDTSSESPNVGFETEVKNGYVYHGEQQLEGIYIKEAADDYVKPDNVEKTEYFIYAHTDKRYEPYTVCEVRIKTVNYGKDGSMWGSDSTYTFINHNGKFVSLGLWKTVENIYALGEDLYFNTSEYGQTISRHYKHNRKLWKLTKDGELTEVSYADYNSMKIIGKANDKLYLKCEWSPENYLEHSPYSVSLVNDGYYTFDGEGIKFISPYIYSDFDILSDNGDIYAVNNVLDKITKCEINPLYY